MKFYFKYWSNAAFGLGIGIWWGYIYRVIYLHIGCWTIYIGFKRGKI